jgi:hypothetical protein
MDLHLHPKQGEALQSAATEILYGGAAGGGKSHLFRAAAIAWCADIPGLQVYLFRRTSPDLFKNHMEGPGGFPALLGEWTAAGLVKTNHSKGQIAFWNGAKIHLCHCQYRKDLNNYQGAEIHVLMIDELTQWPWDMYSFLRGRVRLGGLVLPERHKGRFPRILTGANPGGIGHNAVKMAFVDLAPSMAITEMPKTEGGMRRQYIPARLEDNPTLAENDPDYEARLEALGSPALVRAMRHGDWDIVAGGMFDDVWDKTRHVVAPFEIPASWRVDRAFDWGSSRPFSVGWWAESDGSDVRLAEGTTRSTVPGELYRIAEWYGWNGRPDEGCRMLAKDIALGIREREKGLGLPPGLAVKPGPADSSIFDIENGNCLADDMAAAGVAWEKADKSPGSRKQGWQKLRAMLKAAAAPAGVRDAPGLYVFETCRHFIRTLPVLPRAERDPDDVDSAAEDHIGDETRYRIFTRRRGVTTSEFEI